MNIEFLENIGLTRSEIKVYLSLLELNSASASETAEKSGLYRKNVYDALNRLIKKGLVSSAKIENKQIFTATNPQRLLEFIDLKKKEIQGILPELKSIYKSPPMMEEVSLFKGKEGLKTIFEDILKSRLNYDKFGSGDKFKKFLPYYYPSYQKRKTENCIKCRAIYNENERNEASVKEFIGEIRFLPKEFIHPSTTIIYGTKVAILIWKENPFGVLITSKEVSESYRYYFELLWSNSNS
jgi:HTH-type transcriptional regulator, sugar sensing transcriptional regulator